MAPLEIHANPTEFAKEALLKVFNDITLKHAATTQWSTWHMWDYVERLAPLPAGVETHIWADMSPFASCLGQAHLIQRDIQAALSDSEDLSSNFNEADIALIATKQSSTSDYDYHVVVAVMFQGFCIVADPSLHSTALVVGMNQTKTCEERMLLSGRPGKGTYNYFKDNNGTYSLVTTLGNSPDWRRFVCEIDHSTAVHNLAISSARELVPNGPRFRSLSWSLYDLYLTTIPSATTRRASETSISSLPARSKSTSPSARSRCRSRSKTGSGELRTRLSRIASTSRIRTS
jgi:hypothetical protein